MNELNQNQNRTPLSMDQKSPLGDTPQPSPLGGTGFRKFYLIFGWWVFVFFIALIVIAAAFDGGHPPAGFMIAFAMVVYSLILLIAVLVLSAIRRLARGLFEKNGFLFTFVVPAVVLASYLVEHIILKEDFATFMNSLVITEVPGLLAYVGFLAPVAFIFTVVVTAHLFKAQVPPFWKAVVTPSAHGFLLALFTFQFLTLSANLLFASASVCNLIYGNEPLQKNCYLRRAVAEGDAAACERFNLDMLVTGDCVSAIAGHRRDVRLCGQSPVVSNEWLLSECIARVSVLSGDKGLCDRVPVEMYRSFCLDPPDIEEVIREERARRLSLPLVEKINDFLKGGNISFVDR